MAEQNLSFYADQVVKYFPSVTARAIERLNDSTNRNALSYLHRRMLVKQYSANLKWESLSVNNSIVAADVIALDSSLPLKKRDSIAQANGDIPKMGIELVLREKQLTELGILSRTPGRTQELINRLFADTPKVIQAPYETLEFMFLLGLSSGVTVITETNNVGTGIRIDYGYLTENKFGVTTLWSNTASKPFSDMARVQDKTSGDGNLITRWLMDKTTFQNLAKTDEAKQLYAAFSNFFGATLPVPTLSQINTAALDRYNFTIEIIDRSVQFEKNGVRTKIKPWQTGIAIGLNRDVVGSLTWGTLAEMEHPVENVTYNTVDDFILVSKFRMNRPSLSEHTTSQALVIPVIDAVDTIYQLDSLTIQA
jgi:hypothetical protein